MASTLSRRVLSALCHWLVPAASPLRSRTARRVRLRFLGHDGARSGRPTPAGGERWWRRAGRSPVALARARRGTHRRDRDRRDSADTDRVVPVRSARSVPVLRLRRDGPAIPSLGAGVAVRPAGAGDYRAAAALRLNIREAAEVPASVGGRGRAVHRGGDARFRTARVLPSWVDTGRRQRVAICGVDFGLVRGMAHTAPLWTPRRRKGRAGTGEHDASGAPSGVCDSRRARRAGSRLGAVRAGARHQRRNGAGRVHGQAAARGAVRAPLAYVLAMAGGASNCSD